MKLKFLSVTLLLCSSIANAEIYKWVDKDGSVHFSDQPQPGSTAVTIPQQGLAEDTAPPADNPADIAIDPAAQSTIAQHPAAPAKNIYTALSIQDPPDQGTIRDNNGAIVITIGIQPALNNGDKFQVLLDGKAYGEPQTEIPLKITGVDRGEHELGVEVQDKDGKTLKASNTITIYLHKAAFKR